MPTIKILRGIQGIGKSTWAKEFIKHNPYVRFNKDDIRLMEASTYKRSNGDLVDDVMHSFIESALSKNLNIILDNTFCFLKHIDDIINRYHMYADIEIVSFPNNIEVALKQNANREAFIEPDIIKDFSSAYNKSTIALNKRGYETQELHGFLLRYKIPQKTIVPYTSDETKMNLLVWDVDQTLANKGNRGIYEFNKCNVDSVIESGAFLYNKIDAYGIDLQIFITGRGEEAREPTLKWLQDNINKDIISSQLIMRPAKDFRRDSIVKEEIYNTKLKDKFNIIAWFDDSPKVRKEFLIPYKIPFFDTTYSTHE